MAKVSVRMFATVREASGASSVCVEASSMTELFSRLGRMYGTEFSMLLDRTKKDPEGLVILLNGRNLDRRRLLSQGLIDGDEVAIFPPVSGG